MEADNEENLPDEVEPERLRQQWEREEVSSAMGPGRMKPCPVCGQSIREDSFSCLFCGERVFWNSGPLGRLAYWLRRGKYLLLALLVLIGVGLVLFCW